MVFNIKHMFGGEMVEEYIQKIYEELLKEEQNSAKRISDLQIHLKETQAMIHLLEETNDPNYESFTPRKVNSRNKQKIDELHAEMKELEEAIQQETDYHTQQMKKWKKRRRYCGRRKQMLHAGVTEIHLRKKGTIRLSLKRRRMRDSAFHVNFMTVPYRIFRQWFTWQNCAVNWWIWIRSGVS